MKVKDILVSALKLLSRNDIAEKLGSDGELTAEENETLNTLLFCYNAVENEIALNYVSLTHTETIQSSTGEFFYVVFTHMPYRIKKVVADGKEIKFEVNARYMYADTKVATVTYDYAPTKKNLEGTSDFGMCVGEMLLAYGTCAEFCVISGEIEAADIFESKYRCELDIVRSSGRTSGYLPPRRWV